MRILACTLLALCLAGTASAAETGDGPGPKCYRKVTIDAVFETSKRLVRKARLVHEETDSGQIAMKLFPAIYIEDKVLVSPEYVLLQEVPCTRRILKKAQSLPSTRCERTRGCVELEPAADPLSGEDPLTRP